MNPSSGPKGQPKSLLSTFCVDRIERTTFSSTSKSRAHSPTSDDEDCLTAGNYTTDLAELRPRQGRTKGGSKYEKDHRVQPGSKTLDRKETSHGKLTSHEGATTDGTKNKSRMKKESKKTKKSKHKMMKNILKGLDDEAQVATKYPAHRENLLSSREATSKIGGSRPVTHDPILTDGPITKPRRRHRENEVGMWLSPPTKGVLSSDDNGWEHSLRTVAPVLVTPKNAEFKVVKASGRLVGINPRPTQGMVSRRDSMTSEDKPKNALVIDDELQHGDDEDMDFASWEGMLSIDSSSKSSKGKISWVASWEGKASTDGATERSWVASFGGSFLGEDKDDNSFHFLPPSQEKLIRYLRSYGASDFIAKNIIDDLERQQLDASFLREGEDVDRLQQTVLVEQCAGLQAQNHENVEISSCSSTLQRPSDEIRLRKQSQQVWPPPLEEHFFAITDPWEPYGEKQITNSIVSDPSGKIGALAIMTGNEERVTVAQNADKVILHMQSTRCHRTILLLLSCVGIFGILGFIIYISLIGTTFSSPTSLFPSTAPTFLADTIFNEAILVSGRDPFNVAGSPQLRAVNWMSIVDRYRFEIGSDAWRERYALVVLYYSLSPAEWTRRDRWLEPNLHHCDWSKSISCQLQLPRDRLADSIDMTSRGLKGSIPNELSAFTNLTALVLSVNELRGSLPSSLFLLSNLEKLEVRSNQLSGVLPWSIKSATSLVSLDLSDNKLTGTLSEALNGMTSLRDLDLSRNQLSGTLSTNMNNLTVLSTLNIRHNGFTGTVPNLFDVISKLDYLLLDYNQFTGTIAPWTENLFQRIEISISNNRLTGSIPEYQGGTFQNSSFHLKIYDVSNNMLTGTIATLVGLVPSLLSFNVSGNMLTGTFPTPLTGWVSLKYIAAADNQLTGPIPSTFDSALLKSMDFSGNTMEGSIPLDLYNFSKLEYLNLSDNALNGSIATNLGRLSALRTIDVHNCSFSGTLPTEIGGLTRLKVIDISNNRFIGNLPTELGSLTLVRRMDVSDNSLTGTIPTSLEALDIMNKFATFNNPKLSGSVPANLCSNKVDTLDFMVGCSIECTCCSHESFCNLTLHNNIIERNHED